MAKIDLNRHFDFSIAEPYELKEGDIAVFRAHPPSKGDDWSTKEYDKYKESIKIDHLRKQGARCAYCRNFVEPRGRYEPIEHVVPKSLRPQWMLEPKNLIVTCNPCNNLKNDAMTLVPAAEASTDFPTKSEDFKIFNPHFDRWSEHFQIEDEVFLVSKPNSKGYATIEICHLYEYRIPMNNMRLILMSDESSINALVHRLQNLHDKASNEYQNLTLALDEIRQQSLVRPLFGSELVQIMPNAVSLPTSTNLSSSILRSLTESSADTSIASGALPPPKSDDIGTKDSPK